MEALPLQYLCPLQVICLMKCIIPCREVIVDAYLVQELSQRKGHPSHVPGSLELRKQQELGPELTALMALSTERHSGWMAKLEKAGRLHKTFTRSHLALRSPRSGRTRRAQLKGTRKVQYD